MPTLLVALLAAAPPPGLDAALALSLRGEPIRALSALGALPAAPGSSLAGRILYERARITDEDLRDPAGASKLYEEYTASFPGGPYAGIALDRIRYIAQNGRPPEALAEFEDTLRTFTRGNVEGALARMEALVRRYPTFPLRPRACFWIASVLRQRRQFAEAERWLSLLARDAPGTSDARRADLAVAQIESLRDRFETAMAIDRRYLESQDPLARELARDQLGFAIERRRLLRIFLASLGVLGATLAGLLSGVVRRRAPLRPLPFELRLFLPIAAIFCALTVYEDRKVGAAVALIGAGGSILVYLSAVYLRAGGARGWRGLGQLALSAAAAASLAYSVIYTTNLADLVVDTIEQGADR